MPQQQHQQPSNGNFAAFNQFPPSSSGQFMQNGGFQSTQSIGATGWPQVSQAPAWGAQPNSGMNAFGAPAQQPVNSMFGKPQQQAPPMYGAPPQQAGGFGAFDAPPQSQPPMANPFMVSSAFGFPSQNIVDISAEHRTATADGSTAGEQLHQPLLIVFLKPV
jgi:hypothetical protein